MADAIRNDELVKIIRSHASKIMEHVDSVQIIATVKDGEDTTFLQVGLGNWFARFGSVREWLIKQEERTREDERHDQLEDNDG